MVTNRRISHFLYEAAAMMLEQLHASSQSAAPLFFTFALLAFPIPMAKVPINDPKHWRERAEEARTVADELTDPDAKRRMLKIADDYDELARRAEKRLRGRQNSSP
jgi:hypothetical protein